jgi:hypothetical protein
MFKNLLSSKLALWVSFTLCLCSGVFSQNAMPTSEDSKKQVDYLPGHHPKDLKVLHLALLKSQDILSKKLEEKSISSKDLNEKIFKGKGIFSDVHSFLKMTPEELLNVCTNNTEKSVSFQKRFEQFEMNSINK